jgi:cation transport protein ChaC
MSHDTTDSNRARQDFTGIDSVWLFGYGSLIFKAGFPYLERRPARIRGWERRFWQGSRDHRGTPSGPGRVATLVRHDGAICVGMAYRVTPETFEPLDVREKNGYLRFATAFEFDDGTRVDGLVYIATEDNAAWLGPASSEEIAAHIAASRGPSGPNDEYLLNLAEGLRELGAVDSHVFAIERALRAIEANAAS